jgi:hypothetical protein
MLKTTVARSILLAFVLAACGGAGSPDSTATKQPTATQKAGATVDCAKLTAAATQLLAIQFLAQLTTPDAVEAVKSKQIGNLDIDAFLGAMTDLHALDGVSSPLGDAKASIAAYQKAATDAKALFAMSPVTQAAIDTYLKNDVGTVADFLGKQIAISGAMGAAGC